ncbi:MAG: alpha/beta hydrolase, partial [Deltaproteobacteria bacterium]|nr:alpha/beta hydrolase [Deltaproteobacteria bacterium]
MVKKVRFFSEDYEIEGLLNKKDKKKGVVVTHPHPLYGGDMYNLVVETIVHVYNIKGYSTLKFNFRGVGGSQGTYDDGHGEQKDVLAALSFLGDMGIEQIDLTGYSFGAWVNAHAVQKDVSVKHMVMVSPPAGFMDFSTIADVVKQMCSVWNPNARFEVIDGADHFYGGYLNQLEAVLISI